MIEQITIENFKSIKKMTLDLARVNVFIGANGSGKSNILEAIALASAASRNKLDSEYLSARGVRFSNSRVMRSAFEQESTGKVISLGVLVDGSPSIFQLAHDNGKYSKWTIVEHSAASTAGIEELIDRSNEYMNRLSELEDSIEQGSLRQELEGHLVKLKDLQQKFLSDAGIQGEGFSGNDFMIYSPENRALRSFEDDSLVQPLGPSGEGLFRLLSNSDKRHLEVIKDNLQMIDWFEDFAINEDKFTGEQKIQLRDRYIDETITYFDQRSANEGFLFLLFYMTVLVSEYTPKFFGVDNIDNALNPKLCKDLMKTFVKLSKEYDKQVVLTTHNPAILDGLNLKDDSQRLFVVHRNIHGHTKLQRVLPEMHDASSGVRLSEAFARGYIGGLNTNTAVW